MNDRNKTANDINAIYETEVKRCSLLAERMNAFFNEAVKLYPSDKTRKLVAATELMTEILNKPLTENYTAKNKLDDVYKLSGDFATNSDNNFNMDDVLNPKGNLDLMALCKELGVTE